MIDRKSISTLLLIFACLELTGCDPACKFTANHVTNVQNLTGRDLSLSVCKGMLDGKQDVQFKTNQNGELALGSYEESTFGNSGSSRCVSPQQKTYGIGLSSESFKEAKFCHRANANEVLIVNPSEDCPAETQEQLAPDDDCTSP